MSLLELFFGKKKPSASIARERLQIILAHERVADEHKKDITPTWLPQLQNELVEVVAKYIKINKQDLKINVEKRDNMELLEINVTLPDSIKPNEESVNI